MKKNDLFNRIMKRIQDKAGNVEQKGIGPYSQEDYDMDEADHDGGRADGDMDEVSEVLADNEETEQKMGNPNKAGKHLFPKKGLNIMIAIAQQNQKRRKG